MARKRQEIQLQQEIETQEEWEDMVSKEGVWVIDVYQDWCGPTAAMVGTFKRIKLDLGDALLNFAVAKADTIDSLEKYRGKCEPCFMFYAGGVLVAIVRGANAPLILRTITEQLAYEHKVMEGTAERKEIKDTAIAMMEKDKKEEADEEEKEEGRRMKFKGEIIDYGDSLDMSARETDVKKEVTLCLIKPDAVQAGKAEDIKNELRQRGIEILREEERQLTEDEAKMIYGNLQDQTFYPDLIKYMTSGPSHILVITKGKTGQNIIKEFRDIMGPTDIEEAKEKAPDSLRAKYGKDTMMNCLHGSSSEDMAERELAFFFPDFVAPTVEGKPKLQRTLALIRPDAFKLHKDAILQKIHEAGFSVAMEKELQLSKEQAEEFYSEHRGQPYFEELTTRMTSGPLLALGLAREDAVQGWRQMLGPHEVQKAKEEAPDSLRAQFSVDDTQLNQLHGSGSAADAEKELKFFFPVEQTVAVIKPDAYGTKEEIIEKIHEAGFRIAARKETKLTREMAEEFYADHKDKEYFNDLVEHMISGPTFFMILSREDAVQGWRQLIGPTDPEKAKENPETLRAQFGKDVLQNAVHGSSNPDHAKESIMKIFGDLKFTPDGSVAEKEEEPVNVVREESADPAPEYKNHTAEEQEGVEGKAEHKSVDEDKEGNEAQPETTDEPPSEAEASKEVKEKEAKAETPQPPPESAPEPEPEEKQEVHKDKSPEPDAEESRKVEKEEEGGEVSRKIEDEGTDQQKEGGQEKNKEQDEVTGSGEAQSKVEDSKPEESRETEAEPASETEAKHSSETEAKPSSETEVNPSSETESKPSSETEAKPDDKKGDEQKTEEKENDKNEGQKEGET